VSLMTRSIDGSPPRVCLWEVGLQRCAPMPAIGTTPDWSHYQATVVPDPGTAGLDLFLYADSRVKGSVTTTEYASVQALEVPVATTSLELVADPQQSTLALDLVVWHSTYSTQWQVSNSSRHVLVDGMLNGWLIPRASSNPKISYKGAVAFDAGERLSLAAVFVALLLAAWSWRPQSGARSGFQLLTKRPLRKSMPSEGRSHNREEDA